MKLFSLSLAISFSSSRILDNSSMVHHPVSGFRFPFSLFHFAKHKDTGKTYEILADTFGKRYFCNHLNVCEEVKIMSLHCNNCINNENSVFNVLSQEQKQQLQEKYVCKTVKKGEIIFREGDSPAGLISLSQGKVKVFLEGVGGREQIVRMAKPIGFIGYRALFADEKHKTTAVAIEDSLICIIKKNDLFAIMRENCELCLSILRAFATELGFTFHRTVTLTQKHIRGRLAESLIFLKSTYGLEKDGKTIKAYLSRDDIANLSGMTTPNAIRTLSSFAHEGVIALDGKKIRILDIDDLEHISQLG